MCTPLQDPTKLDGRQNHLRIVAESDSLTVIRQPGDYGSQDWSAAPFV